VQLGGLRALLTRAGAGGEGAALFTALYRSWCHSVGAVLSLCFLAQARRRLARQPPAPGLALAGALCAYPGMAQAPRTSCSLSSTCVI